MLSLLGGVLLLLTALLVDFLAHRGWLRRRDSLAGQLVLITGGWHPYAPARVHTRLRMRPLHLYPHGTMAWCGGR